MKLVLKNNYKDYTDGLLKLNLETLSEQREKIALKFAEDGLKNGVLNDLLPRKKKQHNMEMRNEEPYEITFANTERMKQSSIIYLQNLLNKKAISE